MELTVYGKVQRLRLPFVRKTLLRMKLIALLLSAACVHVFANGKAQTVSLSLKNAPLQQAFTAIEKQTDYRFVYLKEELDRCLPVTIHVKHTPLYDVLYACFQNQPVSYTLEDHLIIIHGKEITHPSHPVRRDIRGRITNTNGIPLLGITIQVKKRHAATATDERGEFYLKDIESTDVLMVSGAEIESREVKVGNKDFLEITVTTKVNRLDQVVVMAYGQTTRRLNTGNISKVTAAEIENQPVSNPLAALAGKVPGMIVTQTSGVPGSAFKVEIRGRSSLDLNYSRNDPLFVIDGVPFEPGNLPTNRIASAANRPNSIEEGGLSPLQSINPGDIESIEVLKDADATAIYGSRGANGVILITTKRSRSDRLSVSFNLYHGFSRVSKTMDMLNTQQYIAMRREAFANDGLQPTNSSAPDLLLWDTTRYTDFKKLLIGHTAGVTNSQLSVSGGHGNTHFLLSGSFRQESTVFSRSLKDKRSAMHFNLNHNTPDGKFSMNFSTIFSRDVNRLIGTDLTRYINTIPNLLLYDSLGNLNWKEAGVNFLRLNGATNPMSQLERKYKSVNRNLSSNLSIHYGITHGLRMIISVGYNLFSSDEQGLFPSSSYAPGSSVSPSSQFANALSQSWIVEPQLQYTKRWHNHKFTILVGSTVQGSTSEVQFINATQFSNDLLLGNAAAAGETSATNNYEAYRYGAIFSRINYSYHNRYILNLTGRRDGSSRFGPDHRFANFGSIGGAWLFGEETWLKDIHHLLSYGKLRASYGMSGNDQIGEYRYLDLWGNSGIYQDGPTLEPLALYNPEYSWEINRKAEMAIETGWLKDRILVSAAYYRNRSSNQLINYQLPVQTGFSAVIRNFPALVQNSGLELLISGKLIASTHFNWSASLNISFPKNKLISFPKLAESSYNQQYKEGSSINSFSGYRYTGIDPSSGIYTFESSMKYELIGNLDPKCYGGFSNNLRFRGFTLDFLFEFRKQRGKNYLSIVNSTQPGRAVNQPVAVLDRWQKTGDASEVQRFTSKSSGDAGKAGYYLGYSDAVYSDASFLRLRNVSLSYEWSPQSGKRQVLKLIKCYLQGQNLFVLTHYKGADPETQEMYVLPPLKVITAGIQFTF